MNFFPRVALVAVVLQLGLGHARADRPDVDQSVMVFGGAMVDENMLDAANVFGSDYEDNALIGLGYQVFPYQFGTFSFGLEAGLAGRFGESTSGEVWGGVVGRHDGVRLGPVRVSPSFTFGLSHVTKSQKGRERDHEQERDGNARTLFYLGPELSLSSDKLPNTEVFWRLHHRSGAWGTLGDMHGGSNANVVGVRYKF
jgi:hypothetical protein